MEFVRNINNVDHIECLKFCRNYKFMDSIKFITYLGDLESIFHIPLDQSGM